MVRSTQPPHTHTHSLKQTHECIHVWTMRTTRSIFRSTQTKRRCFFTTPLFSPSLSFVSLAWNFFYLKILSWFLFGCMIIITVTHPAMYCFTEFEWIKQPNKTNSFANRHFFRWLFQIHNQIERIDRTESDRSVYSFFVFRFEENNYETRKWSLIKTKIELKFSAHSSKCIWTMVLAFKQHAICLLNEGKKTIKMTKNHLNIFNFVWRMVLEKSFVRFQFHRFALFVWVNFFLQLKSSCYDGYNLIAFFVISTLIHLRHIPIWECLDRFETASNEFFSLYIYLPLYHSSFLVFFLYLRFVFCVFCFVLRFCGLLIRRPHTVSLLVSCALTSHILCIEEEPGCHLRHTVNAIQDRKMRKIRVEANRLTRMRMPHQLFHFSCPSFAIAKRECCWGTRPL